MSYQDNFNGMSDAYTAKSESLGAVRAAKLKAWKLANPSASIMDQRNYAKRLEAEDAIALAPASTALNKSRKDATAFSQGFDPTTGKRMVDLWGSPINSKNFAVDVSVRKDRPDQRTVDLRAYNDGTVEDWGNGGFQSTAAPLRANSLESRMNAQTAYEDKVRSQSKDNAQADVYYQNQIKNAGRREAIRSIGGKVANYALDFSRENLNNIPGFNGVFDPVARQVQQVNPVQATQPQVGPTQFDPINGTLDDDKFDFSSIDPSLYIQQPVKSYYPTGGGSYPGNPAGNKQKKQVRPLIF